MLYIAFTGKILDISPLQEEELSPLQEALAAEGAFQATYLLQDRTMYPYEVRVTATYAPGAHLLTIAKPGDNTTYYPMALRKPSGEAYRCVRIPNMNWICTAETNETTFAADIRTRMREAYALLNGTQEQEAEQRTLANTTAACYRQEQGDVKAEYCFSPANDPLHFSLDDGRTIISITAVAYDQAIPESAFNPPMTVTKN